MDPEPSETPTPKDWGPVVTKGPDGARWFSAPNLPDWSLHDLGHDLNEQFSALVGWCIAGTPFDRNAFRAATYAYFDSPVPNPPNSDPFFDNLGVIGRPFAERPLRCMGVWEWAFSIVHDWEASSGLRIHKGSGYYFAGMRDIALGDLDRGFLYMHQAVVEDKISSGIALPATPAVWFVTLDAARMDQAYGNKVAEYEAYLVRQLAGYRSTGPGALTLTDLRDRVGRHPDLFDGLLSMAHVIARLVRHEDPRTGPIRGNEFAPLLLSQVALELCLVIEDALLRAIAKDPLVTGRRPLTFGPLVGWFAPKAHLALTDHELELINRRFRFDFEAVMAEVLDGKLVPEINRSLSDSEADLVVAYGIRNQSAHGLKRPPTATLKFDLVMPRLFSTLFNVIETLYP